MRSIWQWLVLAGLVGTAALTSSCGRNSIKANFCTIGTETLLCDRSEPIPYEKADRYVCLLPDHFDEVVRSCRLEQPIPAHVVFCSIKSENLTLQCEDGKSYLLSERLNDVCMSPDDLQETILKCAILKEHLEPYLPKTFVYSEVK